MILESLDHNLTEKLCCRGCWLDDFKTVLYSEVPSERETASWISNSTARLIWRKLEVALHVLEMGIGVVVIDLDVIFMTVSSQHATASSQPIEHDSFLLL